MDIHSTHLSGLAALRAAVLSLALAAGSASAAPAALPPGISGAWYNPAQPGHGFSVEVFDDERALAYWYVFDDEGRPVHLYIDGRIDGSRILGEAYLGRGMRFGEFDPADHELLRWGSIELDFSDCRSAALSWNPDGPAGGPGFSTGTMPLHQLARVHALPCSLAAPEALPVGLFDGESLARAYVFAQSSNYPAVAAVDPDGRLWSVSRSQQVDGTGVAFVPFGLVATGERDFTAPGLASFAIELRANAGWTDVASDRNDLRLPLDPTPLELNLHGTPVVGYGGTASGGGEAGAELRLATADSPRQLEAPAELPTIAGSYSFAARGQLLSYSVGAAVEADGSICIETMPRTVPCAIAGSVAPAEGAAGEAGFFDVVLHSQVEPEATYVGRGWRERRGDASALVLVTTRGDLGMGFVLDAAN